MSVSKLCKQVEKGTYWSIGIFEIQTKVFLGVSNLLEVSRLSSHTVY
jgi:hypothetical protein